MVKEFFLWRMVPFNPVSTTLVDIFVVAQHEHLLLKLTKKAQATGIEPIPKKLWEMDRGLFGRRIECFVTKGERNPESTKICSRRPPIIGLGHHYQRSHQVNLSMI